LKGDSFRRGKGERKLSGAVGEYQRVLAKEKEKIPRVTGERGKPRTSQKNKGLGSQPAGERPSLKGSSDAKRESLGWAWGKRIEKSG